MLSTHGDASQYFVTFLDNHDLKHRFYYVDPASPDAYDDQVALGLACLLSIQGIPCIYYGTEQGLHGPPNPAAVPSSLSDSAIREALWGKTPAAFDTSHPFYKALAAIAAVRASEPALRYGREYFRPISGDGQRFGISPYAPGILAFSRILNDRELLVVANADTANGHSVQVIDGSLNQPGMAVRVLYSNKAAPTSPGAVTTRPAGDRAGSVGCGDTRPAGRHSRRAQPMEVQILGS